MLLGVRGEDPARQSYVALAPTWGDILTVALATDLFYQRLDLHCQRRLLVKLLFGLANVLANPGPELHLLVVAKPIVSGSWAISGHFLSNWRVIRCVGSVKHR